MSINVAKPIIKQIKDTRDELEFLKKYHYLQRTKKRKKLLRIFQQFMFIIGRKLGVLKFM